MDVLSYTVQAYNFLLGLVGVIVGSVLGPLGWAAGLGLLVLAAGAAALLLRRRAGRLRLRAASGTRDRAGRL